MIGVNERRNNEHHAMAEQCIALKDSKDRIEIQSRKACLRTLILRICISVKCVLQINDMDDMAKLEPIQ